MSTLEPVRALALVVLLAVPAAGQTSPPAGSDPWYGRTSRVQFQALKVAGEGFQVEWPKKDWLVVPSGSLALVLVSKKGDAAVVVQRSSLRQPLDPSDITELFAQLEAESIKEQQKVLDLQARVIDAGARRLVAAQYQRDGALGVERVRQYSVPAGKRLYRLVCISTAGQFLAFDPVFAHIAASFTVLPE
jgi:hypothetical protein